jgi:hydrogenase maturation protease
MVIIGLGSPFLSDDSVGPRVIRALTATGITGVRLVESHAGGLLLLEELAGAQRAVIVDALVDERRSPGDVVVADISAASHNASCSHDCSLPEALAMGRAMGMALPDDTDIRLIGIVARDVSTFSEVLTPAVALAVQRVTNLICSFVAPERYPLPAEAV